MSEMSLIPTARPGLAEPRKSAAPGPASYGTPLKAELRSRQQPPASLSQRSSLGGGLLNPGRADEGLSEPQCQPQRPQSDTGTTLGNALPPLRQGQPPTEQPGLIPLAAQPVQPGSGPHQALTSSPSVGLDQQLGLPIAPAKPSTQQPGAYPVRVAAGGTPADAKPRLEPAAEAQQPGRPQQPLSVSHLSGSMQQQGPAGQPAAGKEAAGPAGQPPAVARPKVKRKKPTGPLWARASLSPPVASSTSAAASSGPEASDGVPAAPAATPADAGASAAQGPAQGSAVSGAALDAGSIPLPTLPGAGQADAEAVAAQGSNNVLADMSMATLQPPQKHDTIGAQNHAAGQAPPLVPQHGAPAMQQQQQPSTSCAAAAAGCPVLIGTEQQQQAASTKAAADSAAASSMDINTEQQWRPASSDAPAPVTTRAHDGTLPVDAELDMFADIAQQPERKGIALRRQQEPAQAQAQVAASAPGMVLPAQPQPKQEAPSMQAQHAAAPQDVQQPVVTVRAQDTPPPQGMLPPPPAQASTALRSRQGPEWSNPAAAVPESSEQELRLSAADAATWKEIQATASPVAAPESSQQLLPPHAAAAGAGKASSSGQSPQKQGPAEAGTLSDPQKLPKPMGWKTVGTWQAGQFVGLKSPLSPSTGPLQPADTSSAGQAAAGAEAAAGPEGSLPTLPLGLQQAGGARHVPAWCVDRPGGSSAPQRQEVMLQMAGSGRPLGVPALAELQVLWTQMHGKWWSSSGGFAPYLHLLQWQPDVVTACQ